MAAAKQRDQYLLDHRVLADHAVDDEEHFVRLGALLNVRQFGHQRVVDLQTAGGVEDHHVAIVGLGEGDGVRAQFRRGDAGFGENRRFELFAEHL